MKLGKPTQIDVLEKIEVVPQLRIHFVLFLDWGTCAQSTEHVVMVISLQLVIQS